MSRSATAGRSRRFLYPDQGDTLASIAAREFPAIPASDAASQLLSWNLHLAVRPFPAGASGAVMCSDIVFLEPPPAP